MYIHPHRSQSPATQGVDGDSPLCREADTVSIYEYCGCIEMVQECTGNEKGHVSLHRYAPRCKQIIPALLRCLGTNYYHCDPWKLAVHNYYLNYGRGQIMHEPKASALSAQDRYLIVRAH